MTTLSEEDVSSWNLLVVLLLGALVGVLILFCDRPWWDARHRDFAHNGAFVLWVALMCAQTALWALALAWLLPSVRRLRREYREANRLEVRASTLIILAIILLLAVGGAFTNSWPNYIPGHSAKVGLLTLIGALVGLVAARGVWFVHGGLKRLEEHLGTKRSLELFLSLQSDLQRFLATLGAILGLLILSAGAQRRVVLAYKPQTEYGYELVLVYGFLFSVLVACIYLPTHLTLTTIGNRIRDAFFPPVPPNSAAWERRMTEREKLGNVLQLQMGPLGRFRASAAILTPFIGSLISLLFK